MASRTQQKKYPQQFQVVCTTPMAEAIRSIAEERGVSKAEVCRDALDRYLADVKAGVTV